MARAWASIFIPCHQRLTAGLLEGMLRCATRHGGRGGQYCVSPCTASTGREDGLLHAIFPLEGLRVDVCWARLYVRHGDTSLFHRAARL